MVPMAFPDVFEPTVTAALLTRLDALRPDSTSPWGEMDVAQMMAHCCIPYEQVTGAAGPGVPFFIRWVARYVVKGKVTNDVPFEQDLPGSKAMLVSDPRNFHLERERLRGFISELHGKGAAFFDGRRHVIYGPLTVREWSNLFYKHLDHHFRQFGA